MALQLCPSGMKHAKSALALGVKHMSLHLNTMDLKTWSFADEAESRVENAALMHFRADGWNGVNVEGGLILNLIKAASFNQIKPTERSAFVESLYAQHWDKPAYSEVDLLKKILSATATRITQSEVNLRGWPGLSKEHLVSFFASLGVERLHAIATIFARSPYDYRAGWPDLTLWHGQEVQFVEIKSPADKLHASQKRLFEDLLVPLGLNVIIADVLPRPISLAVDPFDLNSTDLSRQSTPPKCDTD